MSMQEICTINGQIWAVWEVPGGKHGLLHPGHAINKRFYDQHTGEVWGQRVSVGDSVVKASWHYSPSDKRSMDITLPMEWDEFGLPKDIMPTGLMAAVFVGLMQQLEDLT